MILSGLIAYGGVYAGILLGSFSAEELPVSRHRLRVVQVLLSLVAVVAMAMQGFAGMIIAIAIVFAETAGIMGAVLRHKERTLLLYAVFALGFAVYPSYFMASVIFLYGLVTGSLIAEPYVHDRRIVPWQKPYQVAVRWTVSYPIVLIITLIFLAIVTHI